MPNIVTNMALLPQEAAALEYLAGRTKQSVDILVASMVGYEITKRLALLKRINEPIPDDLQALIPQ